MPFSPLFRFFGMRTVVISESILMIFPVPIVNIPQLSLRRGYVSGRRTDSLILLC